MDTSTFAYIDQSWSQGQAQDCSSVIESLNRNLDTREMLNETNGPSEARKLIHDLTDLKNELYSYLQGTLVAEDKYESDEFKETKKIIESTVKQVADTMDLFQKQKDKVNQLEEVYHEALKVASTSVTEISNFIEFLHGLDVKHSDHSIITKIVKLIRELGDEIKGSSRIKETQTEYEKELYVLKYYLHHFIKPLNGGNIGSTCSLCLQKPVDTFLEPCGHTGCTGCIGKIKDEFDSNCFICRTKISRSRKIYFS